MMERRRQELALVGERYGPLTVAEDLSWFIVEEFPLPAGVYNRPSTRLLYFIGPAYPQTPPDNFLVPAGLRTAAGEPPGKGYKENQEHLGEKWGVFSWHCKGWNPAPGVHEGDSLVTFLLTAEERLREAAA